MTPAADLRRVVGGARQSAGRMRLNRRMRRRLAAWSTAWPDPPPLERHGEPATTVVVPCFNHAEHVPVAVDSLVQQSLPSFDTVLVDDCSTDGTGSLLDGLAASLASKGRVTVIRHARNAGQSASLNEAIRGAGTEWVTVLNDDDWLTPTALERLLAAVRDDPGLAMVGAESRWFTGSGAPPVSDADPVPGVRRFEPATVRGFREPNDLNLTHSGTTMSRDAWLTVGGYQPEAKRRIVPYSDRDLQLRIAALYPVAVVTEPLVWWRSDSSVDAGVNS